MTDPTPNGRMRIDLLTRIQLAALLVLLTCMWLFPQSPEAAASAEVMKQKAENARLEHEILTRVKGWMDTAAEELASAETNANEARTQTDLQAIRTQVQLFKAEIGRFPGIDQAGRFDPDRFVRELTSVVQNEDGVDRGPWFMDFPVNPFTDSSKVIAGTGQAEEQVADSSAGWILNPQTGEVFAANDVEW